MMSMRYEIVNYRILKIGRKWIEGEVPDKGWRAKIEINDVSRDWKVGEVVRFPASVEIERSKYGTKVTVHPISDEKWEEMQTKKLEEEYGRLKEDILSATREGWFPNKKAERISAVAEKLGKGEETREWLTELKEILSHKKAVEKYEKLEEKIMRMSGEDRYSYFEEVMGKITKVAEKYEDLRKRFEEEREIFKKKGREVMRGNIRANFEKAYGVAEESLDEKMMVSATYTDRMMSMIQKAKMEGFEDLAEEMDQKMSMLVLKMQSLETQLEEWYDAETLYNLRKNGVTNRELYLLMKKGYVERGKKYVVETVKLNNKNKMLNLNGLYVKMIREIGGIVLKRDEESVIVLPEEKHATAEKIKERLTKENVWRILQSVKGEDEPYTDERIENSLPKTWNHLKREYVAVLHPDLTVEFISKPTNFTRSRANADLEWTLPTEVGTILVERSGSHRHKPTTIYRRDKDGWRCLGSSEEGLYRLIRKIVEEHLMEEVKEEENNSVPVKEEDEGWEMEI